MREVKVFRGLTAAINLQRRKPQIIKALAAIVKKTKRKQKILIQLYLYHHKPFISTQMVNFYFSNAETK